MITLRKKNAKLSVNGHVLLGMPRLWFPLILTLALATMVIVIAVHLSSQLKSQLLERFQHEQHVAVYHQVQRLNDALVHITNDLVSLSSREAIKNGHEFQTRALLRKFYEHHKSFVVAGYRMDKEGLLKFVEGKDRAGEGHDISSQAHVQELFETGKIVSSGSFKAVEGYYAIAVHVPIFKNGQLEGSLATLVRWDGLKSWFSLSLKEGNEFIILLDRDCRVVFHPFKDQVGMVLGKTPKLMINGEKTGPEFFLSAQRFLAEGLFLGEEKYVFASHPFVFEGNRYTLLYGAPLKNILGPVNRSLFLTALLAGLSIIVIAVGLTYFFYSYFKERQIREIYQEDVKKESMERRQAQKSLKETRDTFLTVLNSIPATVYVSEIEHHRILFMNQRMEEDFNIKKWENKRCYEVFRNEKNPCEFCTSPHLLDQDGNPTKVHIWEDKNPVSGKWYQNFDRAIKWIDGRMVRIQIATDISSLKIYESQQKEMAKTLQRAQKMEAIGTLAGGVAHDLNNVLSGIVTYPELLLMELPEKSAMVQPLQAIQNSGQKAAEIVNDLLTLGRRGVSVSQIVNINDIISDYMKSPEHSKLKSYHPGISITSRLDPELYEIKGSPIHLRKTIMNLVSNAVEAHPAKGRVEILTRLEYLETPVKGYDDVTEGLYVVIEVRDQGTGISVKDLDHIFEPFYTKKVMGRSGTGLGMAVVWGTVQDHGGYICVDSKEGHGTTILLYFQATDEKEEKHEDRIPLEVLKGNQEHILVIDDMEEQRMIACGVLEKLNYKVSSVESGERAVDLVRQSNYDLLVLDMIMTFGMDGLDTCKKILKINPDQNIILASGFSETERVKEALSLGAKAYIKKPYSLEELGRAVKNAL